MTIYRFTAQALTPIHIGCGTEIDPTSFVLKDKALIQFNPSQVIGELSEEDRIRFVSVSERSNIKEIQTFLRSKVDECRHALLRLDTSEAFRREFESKAANPGNQFRVEMMPRTTNGATVYLPGSSIKGSIRTAVINHFTNHLETSKTKVHNSVNAAIQNKKWVALEESALNRQIKETEKDLFRLIGVGDVLLPNGATRIDRVVNYNPKKEGSEKIKMWFERLKSLADDQTPPHFNVDITINDKAMAHPKVKSLLGRTLGIQSIMRACNQFYWGRMQAEGEKFDGLKAGSSFWKAIHGCFPKGRLNGEILTIDPSQPFWNNSEYNMHYVLLRVGRFSHFESLSVDELREGYNIQAKRPIIGMGATRIRCAMENGKPLMPFGWMILKLQETVRK